MVLIFYSYAFSPSSPLYSASARSFSHPPSHVHNPSYAPATWGGDGLKNRVFFTFIFVEMISWFWVWVTLREEKATMASRKPSRRRSSAGYGSAY